MTDTEQTSAEQSGGRIWLVYSRQHNAFWRPSARGYTWEIEAAGRYTHEEAVTFCNTQDQQRDGSPSEVAVIAPEAADAIAALQAERDKLSEFAIEHSKTFIKSLKRAETAEAALVELRAVVEAARPFADFVRPLLKRLPIDMQLTAGTSMAGRQLTVRDFAELAAALDRLGDGEGRDG